MSFDLLARALAAAFIVVGVILVVPELAGVGKLRALEKRLERLGHLREGPFFRHRHPGLTMRVSACFLMLVGPAVFAFFIAFIPFSQGVTNSTWVAIQIILPPLLVLYIAPVVVKGMVWWGSNLPGKVVWTLGAISALTGLGMLVERL